MLDMSAMCTFIERPYDAAEIEQFFLSHRTGRRVFVLYGLAGIGKTQLAADFSRRHGANFTSIIWLNAATESTLRESLAIHAHSTFPERTGDTPSTSEQAVRFMLQWLASPNNTEWLLVLDGVGQGCGGNSATKGAYIKRYLPSGHGSVLITTRLSHLAALGSSKLLRPVNAEVGKAIFDQYCKFHSSPPCQCSPYTSQFVMLTDTAYDPSRILERLGGIPVAIAEAALYVSETGCDEASYIRMFDEEWCSFVASNEASGHWLLDYHGSMTAVWTKLFQAIQAEDGAAARLLLFWSRIDHSDLWFDLLRSTNLSESRWPWFKDLASSEVKFLSVMRLLLRYSIVEKHAHGYYMHPLVHRWLSHLPGDSEIADYQQLALSAIGQVTPPNVSRDFWSKQMRLMPHANRCAASLKRGVSPQEYDAVVVSSIHLLGDLSLDQGLLDQAEFLYRHALERCKALFDPYDLRTLVIMKSLANACSRLARPGAERLYRLTLEACEGTLGTGHPLTLEVVNDLASLCVDQNRLQEAETLFDWALEGKKLILGPDDPSTLNTMSSLANAYAQKVHVQDDAGEVEEREEAEQRYLQAIAGLMKALGLEHPFTLNALSNLGLLYARIGRLEDAEAFCRCALAGYEESFGAAHPQTLNIVHNIGTILSDQHKRDAAALMYRRAVEGYQQALGPEHPTTLNATSNLLSISEASSRPTEADRLGESLTPRRQLEATQQATQSPFNLVVRVLEGKGLHDMVENMLLWAASGSRLAQILANKIACPQS